jgi:YVTN family beta-propeller protein
MIARLSLGLLLLSSAALADAPDYVLTKTVPLGAPDRWDYVAYDAPSHRVYIAHGDRLTAVDGRDGTKLGDVTGFPGGTHGTAIVTRYGRGYTDDGKAGTVSAFDLTTLKTGKTIPASPDADGMAFDPTSGHIFVIDGDSAKVTVIDPAADAAVTTIEAGEALEAADTDGHGKLFVNGEADNNVLVIDTKTNKVTARDALPGCQRPHGMAVDGEHARVFVSCPNGVMVVLDGNSGAVLASLPIGKYSDSAAYDPKRKRAFSANGDGTLSVIEERDPKTFVLAATVKTAPGARTMAVDPESGRVFLVTADIDRINPPTEAGGRPYPHYVPGSFKLMFFDPR